MHLFQCNKGKPLDVWEGEFAYPLKKSSISKQKQEYLSLTNIFHVHISEMLFCVIFIHRINPQHAGGEKVICILFFTLSPSPHAFKAPPLSWFLFEMQKKQTRRK